MTFYDSAGGRYEPATVRVTVRFKPSVVAAIDEAVRRVNTGTIYADADRSEFIAAAVRAALKNGAGRFEPALSDSRPSDAARAPSDETPANRRTLSRTRRGRP